MTLHLELLTAESADALIVRAEVSAREAIVENRRDPEAKPAPADVPEVETAAGTWAY